MLHEHLAHMGRRGDTQLAHVTKGEMALLKALGGSGTRNPKTGLPEFYDASYDGGQEGSGQTDGNIGGGGLGLSEGPSGYMSPGEMDQTLANEQSKNVQTPDYSSNERGSYTSPGEVDQQLANEQASGVKTPDYSSNERGGFFNFDGNRH